MLGLGTLDIEDLCDLVRAEYQEMPGLCLTEPQVRRLWDLDPSACDALLHQLLAEGFLRHTDEDEYVLAWRPARTTTAASHTSSRNHSRA
jgi:DNA-binding IclR family transcriptional regulator